MKNKKDFETIYTEYFEIVYKYLCFLTQNSDIAEELTQETFYKAILKIDTFKGQSQISSWLCQIAKNLWYDELKKNRKIDSFDCNIFTQISSNENIESDFIKAEEQQELLKKINSLDEITRNVMLFRISGNLTFKEIAEILR